LEDGGCSKNMFTGKNSLVFLGLRSKFLKIYLKCQQPSTVSLSLTYASYILTLGDVS
jgi:hypothetical protein